MKNTEDVHEFATEYSVSKEKPLKRGMEAKLMEFGQKGAEDYAKA
jgi:hypothetical protein